MMQIGEVAARTELSLRSLRHWDEVGLVSPSVYSPGGFRLYTEADVERILLIRRMKPLGFSLERMREFCRALDDGTVIVQDLHGNLFLRVDAHLNNNYENKKPAPHTAASLERRLPRDTKPL